MRTAHPFATVSIVGFALGCADGSPDQATLPGLGDEAGNEAFCARANLPLGRLWDT
jgi:hypothetical protein